MLELLIAKTDLTEQQSEQALSVSGVGDMVRETMGGATHISALPVSGSVRLPAANHYATAAVSTDVTTTALLR